VVDTSNARIVEFSSSGTFISQFGSYGSVNGQFVQPQSIAIAVGQTQTAGSSKSN
jgi:hypothetical protein